MTKFQSDGVFSLSNVPGFFIFSAEIFRRDKKVEEEHDIFQPFVLLMIKAVAWVYKPFFDELESLKGDRMSQKEKALRMC